MGGTKTSRVVGRPSCVPTRKRLAGSSRRKFVPKAAAEKTELRAETEEERKERFKKVFSAPRQQEGLAAVLSNVPTPVLYGASAALAGAAAFAGYTAGSKAPAPQPVTSVAVAAVGAVATGAAAVKAKGARDSGAGVELWNAMVDSEDPTTLDPNTVKAINEKYAVDMSSAQLLEVKQVYSAYLQSMIPAGDVPLRGDEAVKLREFLTALGLPDEEAAQCHIDVGRNFFRSRLEVAGRDAQFEELRAFQKIVYVSGMLFGELRSGFLTPWVARFPGVTPEQVAVAKRDGARTIMRGRVTGDFGGKIPATAAALAELRRVQLNLGLSDDACAGLVQEFVAKDVDARLKDAVAVMKTRGASVDYSPAVNALDALLDLSAQYQAFADGDTGEEKQVVPGIGAITSAGTSYATENNNDLLDLYRLYMETKLKESGDVLSKEISSRLAALVPLLGLNAGRAEDTRLKIVVDAYTRLLRNAVKSGALDSSTSPATMLNQMLSQVGMPGEQAAALHEQLYRQKLEDCVRDNKIDDSDVAALERTARLLCIPAARVAAMDAEVKGRILRSAIRSAFDVGIDAFGKYERENMLKVKEDLRMDGDAAFKVLEEMGRQEMVKLINTARLKSNKLENARELRNVVYFSNIILAPLVEVLKGKGEEKASKEDAMKELMEVMAKAKAEADAEEKAKKDGEEAESPAEAVEAESPVQPEASDAADDAAAAAQEQSEPSTSDTLPSSLAKAEKAASDRASGETITNAAGKEITMSSQKDITVADDFDRRELVEIYRTYLMFCLTGDVVQLPMGGTIVVERDEAEFARLSQLGDVLGLTQFDVYEVHSAMAEQAFKSQAEALAVGGTINSETRTKLDEMAKQMGIPDDTAQKIMRGITNRHIAGNLSSLKAQGELTLSKILDLQAMDIDVSSVVGPSVLQQLYTQELESQVGSGRGAIDTEDLLHALPGKLGIEVEKAKSIADTVAKDRARGIMVQAIADYRRNNAAEAVKYLNNFLACWRLSGGDLKGAGKRSSKEEALDVYGMYCAKTESDDLKDEMARALELDETDSRNVREAVAAGTFGKAVAKEHAGAGADTSDSIF